MRRPKDKARREEIAKLKHKRRCRPIGLIPEQNYLYKSTTKPCSCHLCSAQKEKKGFKHQRDMQKLYESPFKIGRR